MAVLVDTGPLYALADVADRAHTLVRRWLAENRDPLVIPVTILPEVAYLINRRHGSHSEARWLRSLVQGGLPIEPLMTPDLDRCVELVETYAGSDLGFVDASLVAIAERLRISRLLSLDRRHFGIVKPRHWRSFELVP